MVRLVLAVTFTLALSSGVLAQESEQRNITSLTAAEVASIAEAMGWSVGETIDDGDFVIALTLPSGMPVYFEGISCASDDVPGCPEWELRSQYGVGSADRASRLADEISYRWLDDWSEGEVLGVSRMDFLYGGVSRQHLEATFQVFETLVDETTAKVFPCGLPVDGQTPDC
jgi:hypothetical protein